MAWSSLILLLIPLSMQVRGTVGWGWPWKTQTSFLTKRPGSYPVHSLPVRLFFEDRNSYDCLLFVRSSLMVACVYWDVTRVIEIFFGNKSYVPADFGCLEYDIDYDGNGLTFIDNVQSVKDCQRHCQLDVDCKVFSYVTPAYGGSYTLRCYLKTSSAGWMLRPNKISGPKFCP